MTTAASYSLKYQTVILRFFSNLFSSRRKNVSFIFIVAYHVWSLSLCNIQALRPIQYGIFSYPNRLLSLKSRKSSMKNCNTNNINSDDHEGKQNNDRPALSLRNRRHQKRLIQQDLERGINTNNNEALLKSLLTLDDNESNSRCLLTPQSLQCDDLISRSNHQHIQFYGFDTLFPDSNLGEIFDMNSEFRTAIRIAVRSDFFVPDDTLSECTKRMMLDPRSTLMSSWKQMYHTNNYDFPQLNEVFRNYDILNLNGNQFMATLISLCKDSPYTFGSWIDIIGIKDRRLTHSWHQDSGLKQFTVMVGFPPCNNYDGIGVFSHAVKLSHRLPTPDNTNEPRLWTSVEQSNNDSNNNNASASSIPEEYIIRPR